MDPFVDQLKRLCAAHPTRTKWVWVPTHGIGRTLGERIARENTNWLNLRFVTPLDIALVMGAPFLVERGISPSEEGLGPALMMRLLLNLPTQDGYFRPLADHPTMAQALWSTVNELRSARIGPETLNNEGFSSAAKHVELHALLAAYEQFLTDNKRGDLATIYEEALKHPEWCPIKNADCWTELPDAFWTRLQRALIDVTPGERIAPLAFQIPGVTIPRRLSSQNIKRLDPKMETNELAFLMDPSSGSGDIPGEERVSLFHAGGHEAEIEEVFRRALATHASLDQIEIACASDAHVALIWEKALRHDWPVTLGPGIPATLTRPGRALIGFCEWLETDFSAGHFRRLLQSGDLAIKDESLGFTAGQASRILGRSNAGWGRATYDLALGQLQRSYESRAADPDASDDGRLDAKQKGESTSKIRSWISGLVTSIPEPAADGTIPLQAIVAVVLAFLEHTAARSSALDQKACSALRDHIAELSALGAFSCSLMQAIRFIYERVQSLSVASERARPGHLYVCRLAQAGYAGRKHLFVVGLEEGRVFSSSTEDPVLLDEERTAISSDLRLSADRVDEAVYSFLTRLAASSSAVTFSYSCRDTREYRETYASWIMLQALRLKRRDSTLNYRDLKKELGEPKSAVPENRQNSTSLDDWWLRSVAGSGTEGVHEVRAAFPSIAKGQDAETLRQSLAFTAFDGYVPDAGAVLDPCAPESVYSVTELEGTAECPFRFFLKRGLGIRPVDEHERANDIWLDPLMRGSLLHDLYATFLRRIRDESRRPTKADAKWLIAQARARLQTLNKEMPAPSAEIFERESADLVADVELFVEAETSNTRTTPLGFEVSFGRPLEKSDSEPLARPGPVAIELGNGITFRIAGRIDRIDQVGPSKFEIIDYKTGGYWEDKWKGTFDRGRRLQHALYGLAAVELLKARHKNPVVVDGVYYFSSHKGGQRRLAILAPAKDAIASVLGDLRDLILAGQFLRTSDAGDCRFCDYVAACGGKVNEQAKTKLAEDALETSRRLHRHV